MICIRQANCESFELIMLCRYGDAHLDQIRVTKIVTHHADS